jgi:multiple sugar transport system permease protein
MSAMPETRPRPATAAWQPPAPAPGFGRRVARWVAFGVVAAGGVVFALPFLWMVLTSVSGGARFRFVPGEFDLSGYVEPWRTLPFARFYLNTALITGLNILGALLSSSLVAFAFARMRFRGRNVLFGLVLATMMLPEQVTLIPTYLLWARLDLINTIWPLVVPSWLGEAFIVFLLRQYMLTIPRDLDDAARLDGAGWFRVYWNVALPLSAPALGVAAIFVFTYHWTAFLRPLIFLNDPEAYTVPLGLALLAGSSPNPQATMAQTVLSLLPLLAVFFLTQKRFVQGMTIGALKG